MDELDNPMNYLTEEQAEVLAKEMREEGYCVLQRWTNKQGEMDYRVLTDTVIVTPLSIYDRISWVFKKVIGK